MQAKSNKRDSWKLIGLIQKHQHQAGPDAGFDANIVNAIAPAIETSVSLPEETLAAVPPRPNPSSASFTGFIPVLSVVGLVLVVVTGSGLLPLPDTIILTLFAALFGLTFLYSGFFPLKSKTPAQTSSLDSELLQDQNWELQEQDFRNRTLVESFGDLVMDRDTDGKISFLNSKFAEFLGTTQDQLIGDRFPGSLLEEEVSNPTTDAGKIRQVRIKVGNSSRWLAWIDLPFRDEETGKTITRTVAREITDQKNVELELRNAREKAEAASEAKTRFLANVSHEMRTPLNGILGMSGLLADSKLTPEQSTYVNAVRDSGVALLTLIEDILDMTLVEAGRLEFRSTFVSPHQLVENVCELLASRAHAKNISISSYISANVPDEIRVDAGRLRQILINLIGNAIKFTEEGGVHVSVVVEDSQSASNGDFITLSFKINDTGPGIAEKDQNLIFEEFSQADSKSTRKHGGAGLGLTISRRIIEEMGGKISVESKLDVGSCFRIHIQCEAGQGSLEEFALPTGIGDVHVSIIGSDDLSGKAIQSYLAEVGISCEAATAKALTGTPADSQALVICDNPSEMSASDLGVILEGAWRKIVVLKPEERHQLDELLAKGFDGYLIKPIRKASLLGLIVGQNPDRPDGREQSRAQAFVPDESFRNEQKSVLLAEDNDINALLARKLLEKAGHRVVRANNGMEALQLFEEHMNNDPFDLILLDLQMPVMDGREAMEKIRRVESGASKHPVRIFVLTADEQAETRETVMKEGADGFLTKPLDPTTLLSTVSDLKSSQ